MMHPIHGVSSSIDGVAVMNLPIHEYAVKLRPEPGTMA